MARSEQLGASQVKGTSFLRITHQEPGYSLLRRKKWIFNRHGVGILTLFHWLGPLLVCVRVLYHIRTVSK